MTIGLSRIAADDDTIAGLQPGMGVDALVAGLAGAEHDLAADARSALELDDRDGQLGVAPAHRDRVAAVPAGQVEHPPRVPGGDHLGHVVARQARVFEEQFSERDLRRRGRVLRIGGRRGQRWRAERAGWPSRPPPTGRRRPSSCASPRRKPPRSSVPRFPCRRLWGCRSSAECGRPPPRALPSPTPLRSPRIRHREAVAYAETCSARSPRRSAESEARPQRDGDPCRERCPAPVVNGPLGPES